MHKYCFTLSPLLPPSPPVSYLPPLLFKCMPPYLFAIIVVLCACVYMCVCVCLYACLHILVQGVYRHVESVFQT